MEDVSRPSLVDKVASYARKVLGTADDSQPKKETVVLCPAKQMPAEVQLDADERLIACSRLPADGSCEQACAEQLQYSSTNLATFLSQYEGKTCVKCGKSIGASDWYGSRAMVEAEPRRHAPFAPAQPLCFQCWTGEKL